MKIKVEKRLRQADIRNMCIIHGYYTCGTVNDYCEMLKMCDSNKVTNNLIFKIAVNIVNHSDLSAYGMTYKDNIESVMFDVGKCVKDFFEIIEE